MTYTISKGLAYIITLYTITSLGTVDVTSTLTLTLRLKRGMFDSQRYLKIIADLCSRNKKKSNRIKLQKK